MSWPAACSARSGGTASSGVPKKTRRTRRLGELAVAQLRQCGAADLGLEPVEQQHAVEMVDLVLDHAREQLVALEHDLVPVEVEAAHGDVFRAHDLEVEAGHGEATLLRRDLTRGLDDLGVD